MSRTRHHNHAQRWRDPAWYRRQLSRLFRARCKHRLRVGRYDVMPRLNRQIGYYW
jgi:hypothetical protein